MVQNIQGRKERGIKYRVGEFQFKIQDTFIAEHTAKMESTGYILLFPSVMFYYRGIKNLIHCLA